MDERIDRLEMKISFLEDMVSQLNSLVVEMGREQDELRMVLKVLDQRVLDLHDSASDVPTRRPPHY